MDASQQQNAQVKIGGTYPSPLTEHGPAVKLARAKMADVFRRDGFREASKVVYEKLGSRRRQSKRSGRSQKVKRADKPNSQLSFFDWYRGAWFDGFSDGLIFDQRLFWVLCVMLLIVKGAGKFSLDYLLGMEKDSRQQK